MTNMICVAVTGGVELSTAVTPICTVRSPSCWALIVLKVIPPAVVIPPLVAEAAVAQSVDMLGSAALGTTSKEMLAGSVKPLVALVVGKIWSGKVDVLSDGSYVCAPGRIQIGEFVPVVALPVEPVVVPTLMIILPARQ